MTHCLDELTQVFFKGSAAGIGLAVGLVLARAAVTQIAKSAGDKFRSLLRMGEMGYEQTLKAALDFKARQLAEF